MSEQLETPDPFLGKELYERDHSPEFVYKRAKIVADLVDRILTDDSVKAASTLYNEGTRRGEFTHNRGYKYESEVATGYGALEHISTSVNLSRSRQRDGSLWVNEYFVFMKHEITNFPLSFDAPDFERHIRLVLKEDSAVTSMSSFDLTAEKDDISRSLPLTTYDFQQLISELVNLKNANTSSQRASSEDNIG